MFEIVKIGGIWQIWNLTCDGSVIVENGHRNMGFFKKPGGAKTKALINVLKGIEPVFSLSTDFSRIVLNLDLKQNAKGFHVFDYTQLKEAGIDISSYVQVFDFRLGSFVVFKGEIFTAERIADELDTYPGHPFLTRHFEGQKPAPIEPKESFKIIVPYREDAKTKLLKSARESWCDPKQWDQVKLEEQVENYLDIYCHPDLDLKIPVSYCGKVVEQLLPS